MPTTPSTPSDPGAWSPTPVIRASIGVHAASLAALPAFPELWPWLVGAVAANHALLGALGMVPRNRLLGPNLVRLPESAARLGLVGLCFDDGPDPAVTPAVLDLLDRHGATASFFCVGSRARAHPAIVRAMSDRGHSVENHTATHPLAFAAFGMGAMRRQVEGAQWTLADLAGQPPRFFRAPAGLRSPLLDPVMTRLGLRYTTWTRRGYDSIRRNPDAVLRHLTNGLRGGDILLLHDGACARSRAGQPMILAVLPRLLATLDAQGLRPVSLPAALMISRDGRCCSTLDRATPATAPGASAPR